MTDETKTNRMKAEEDQKRLDEKLEAWRNASNEMTELGCNRITLEHRLEVAIRKYNTRKASLQNSMIDLDKKIEEVNERLGGMKKNWMR